MVMSSACLIIFPDVVRKLIEMFQRIGPHWVSWDTPWFDGGVRCSVRFVGQSKHRFDNILDIAFVSNFFL